MVTKTSDEWYKELSEMARPLGCRIVYKWWVFHLYEKDHIGVERYVHGLESINDIKKYLKDKKRRTESDD